MLIFTENRSTSFIIAATLVLVSLCMEFIHEAHAHTQPRQSRNANANHLQITASKSGRNLFKVLRRNSNGQLSATDLDNHRSQHQYSAKLNNASSNDGLSLQQQSLAVDELPQQFLQPSQSWHEDDRQNEGSFEASDTNEEDGRIASMNVSPVRRMTLPQYIFLPSSSTTATARPTLKSPASTTTIDNSIKKDRPSCLTCASQQLAESISPLTLREIRLEMIKNQILRKLRLRQAPSATQVGNIPDYVHRALQHYHSQYVHQDIDNEPEDLGDDFDDDSRTEQIIVFPENVQSGCGSPDNVCLTFTVPNEIHKEKVSSAELWIYVASQSNTRPTPISSTPIRQQQFSFSAADISRDGNPQEHTQEFGENADSWAKLNVTDIVSNWSLSNFSIITKSELKTLRLTCKTSTGGMSFNSTGWSADMTSMSRRPFLIVNMDDSLKKRRTRRSINCRPGINECCREHLEVDFDEIKWNWIIEPRKYHAYFCKGSCLDRNGNFHSSSNQHSLHLERVIAQRGINNETRSMLPCCAATRMSGISILYVASNGTAMIKYVPNMVVESCGCH